MPAIQTWQPAISLAPILQSLRNGECVVLPTESTYELVGSALQASAVARLQALAQEVSPPAIAMSADADWHDWMPLLRGAGARLIRKLGPGPLVLRANGGYAYGLWPRLPRTARDFLLRDGLL